METTNIPLTGILIGDDQSGYVSFFKEIPFVSAEGRTVKEAQINLYEMIVFAFECMKEEEGTAADDYRDGPSNHQYQTFNATLTLAQ